MSGLNIFVVEVHDFRREATVIALRSMGHTVASTKALDKSLHVFSTDILLLSLTDEDGLSLVRRIRANQPAIGIIVITPGAPGDEPVSYTHLTLPTNREV